MLVGSAMNLAMSMPVHLQMHSGWQPGGLSSSWPGGLQEDLIFTATYLLAPPTLGHSRRWGDLPRLETLWKTWGHPGIQVHSTAGKGWGDSHRESQGLVAQRSSFLLDSVSSAGYDRDGDAQGQQSRELPRAGPCWPCFHRTPEQ